MKDLISFKHELQNIINGTVAAGENQLIKTVQTYLGKNFATGKNAEEAKHSREQEEKSLSRFINESNLWISSEQFGSYVTEGAEQKVYFPGETDYIIKVSDAIFYEYWKDYFDNLLIHNHLFPDTVYTLLGFFDSEDKLFAVLKQQFVQADETTNLDTLRKFMENNGFILKKNNDYYHPFLGLL